jgi:hypothetical protein
MASSKNQNLGLGVFLFFIGFALLAQRMGWVSFDSKLLLPIGLMAWGLSYILNALRK